MGIILIILALALAILTPILWIIFISKGKSMPPQITGPWGPRRRDGALTYNEFRGMRTNVELEDPRDSHNPRYQRRHSSRQRKQTKPWMK